MNMSDMNQYVCKPADDVWDHNDEGRFPRRSKHMVWHCSWVRPKRFVTHDWTKRRVRDVHRRWNRPSTSINKDTKLGLDDMTSRLGYFHNIPILMLIIAWPLKATIPSRRAKNRKKE